MVEVGVEFVADNDAFEGVQPSDGAFDLPSSPVASEFSAVLRLRSNTPFAMRADQIDAAIGESLTEQVAVGGAVVDQPTRNIRREGRIQQRLDQVNFSMVGRFDVDRQRQPLAVGEDHDLRPFASAGGANAIAPFFAEANVPSAKPSSQFNLPDSSSSAASRSSAWSSRPLVVHSTKRRQQVGYDGKDFGRSFQRAPVRSTHSTPSKQARESILGRPPSGPGGGVGNKSSISPHCSSLSSRGKQSDSGSVLDPATKRDRSVIKSLLSEPTTDDSNEAFS